MSLALLDQALQQVPFLTTLGIRVEEASAGHVVLRLPHSRALTNHAGSLHNAAVFAVGELAASVAVATHPELSRLTQLQKSTKVKYFLPSAQDVTAHASITPEMVARVHSSVAAGPVDLEIPVKVLDGHGRDVAELLPKLAFRRR